MLAKASQSMPPHLSALAVLLTVVLLKQTQRMSCSIPITVNLQDPAREGLLVVR